VVFITVIEYVICDVIVETEERAEHVASIMIDCKRLFIDV
jgi:hypothetical protein